VGLGLGSGPKSISTSLEATVGSCLAPVGLGCSLDVVLVRSVHVASSLAAILEKFPAVGCSSGDGPTSSVVDLLIPSLIDVSFSLGWSSLETVPGLFALTTGFPTSLAILGCYSSELLAKGRKPGGALKPSKGSPARGQLHTFNMA